MSDSPENLRLVLATWPKVPMRLRVPLILSMTYGGVTPPFETEVPNSPVFRAFSQEVLLTTLEDVTEVPDFSLPTEEGVVYWPRLCDLAAAALHARWPEKYPFDVHAPESVRDRQRLVMLNARRRREDGLAGIAAPTGAYRVPAGQMEPCHCRGMGGRVGGSQSGAAPAVRGLVQSPASGRTPSLLP